MTSRKQCAIVKLGIFIIQPAAKPLCNGVAMRNEIRFQLKSIFSSTGFICVCIFSLLFSVVSFVITCILVYGDDILSVPAAYEQFYLNARTDSWFILIFSMVFPFLACCAASDSYVSDYSRKYLPACITRTGLKKYYFSKQFAVFISGAFVITIPQLINYLLCVITFPGESTHLYTLDLWQSYLYIYGIAEHFVFRNLYLFSPCLYFLVFILFSGIMAGVIAVIGLQLSFFVRNRIFAVSFMFIFMNLTARCFETYSIPLDLNDYIFGAAVGGMTYPYMFLTLAIYFALVVLPTPFAIRRLKNCI